MEDRGLVTGATLTIGSIVWGVRNYREAIRFWTAALDYEPKREPDDDWALLVPRSGRGVQLAIQLVTSDAESHQRHHLDLYAKDQAAQVERLIGLGATPVDWRYPPDADYVVLADPDGNTFCVIDTSDDPAQTTLSIAPQAGRAHGGTPPDQPIPAHDAFTYRGARALTILHERELRAFLPVWREARARDLRLPATDDSDYDSLEHLLTHVLRAAGRYIVWVCKALELPDPGVPPEPPLSQIAERADEYLDQVLTAWREPLHAVPVERFEDRTHTSNWGAQMTVESMLEHAVAHPMRHSLQLRALLAEDL